MSQGRVGRRSRAEQDIQSLRQQGSASSYARRFQELASELEWKDKALMFFFYQGLKDNVKDILVFRNQPDTLEEYINMAVELDDRLFQRHLEGTVEKAGHH